MDIVSLGEVLVDMLPQGTSTRGNLPAYLPRAGGAPCNVLAQAARLGRQTALISCVGDDFFGTYLRAVLGEENIDIRNLQTSREARTTLAFVSHDAAGDRSFAFYRNPGADIQVQMTKRAEELIQASKIFHCGSLTLTADPARQATMEALSIASANGVLVSFDPNFRPDLWKSLQDLLEACLKVLPFVQVLKGSADELASLVHYRQTGQAFLPDPDSIDEEDIQGLITDLFDHFDLSLIAVTNGSKPAYLANRQEVSSSPVQKLKAVDTTGCGDSFMGALLTCLLEEADRLGLTCQEAPLWAGQEENDFFIQLSLKNMLAFANAAGSLTALKEGSIASLPDRKQILKLLEGMVKI